MALNPKIPRQNFARLEGGSGKLNLLPADSRVCNLRIIYALRAAVLAYKTNFALRNFLHL